MKHLYKLILVTLLILYGSSYSQITIDSSYQIGRWQGFRQGAVSFTFDDNCPGQLATVVPMFDEYGYKLTLFTVINWGPNWSGLQSAADNGHEIGSHTLSHGSLNGMSDADQETELKNSQADINSHIKGQKCVTIAYPNCLVGNTTLCEKYYIAARGCSGQIESATPGNFMNISSFVCGSQGSIKTSLDFANKAKSAAASKGWVVFLMHAIDKDNGYSPTTSANIRGALDSLYANDAKIWVNTFGNIVRYVRERNCTSINEISSTDSLVTFEVIDTLDNAIYNYPITIRRIFPQGWQDAQISQNGKIINYDVVEENSKKYIMFDVVPDSGVISISRKNLTGIGNQHSSVPSTPYLAQNYPNPFNPVTRIDYKITENNLVSLKVYDVLGREVATLVNRQMRAGKYSVSFDASNLSSGLYFYTLKTGNYSDTKKLVLLK